MTDLQIGHHYTVTFKQHYRRDIETIADARYLGRWSWSYEGGDAGVAGPVFLHDGHHVVLNDKELISVE